MTHLTVIEGNRPSDHSTTHDASTPPTEQTADLALTMVPRRVDCCTVSAEDEFSYRNPYVLGDAIVRVGRLVVEAAGRGDEGELHQLAAYLGDRYADARALDDHTQRHLVESICSSIDRDAQYAHYRHLNPADESDAGGPDHYDDCNDDYWDERCDCVGDCGSDCVAQIAGDQNETDTLPRPHGRIRIRRPRTPAVASATEHADTTNTPPRSPRNQTSAEGEPR